MPTQVTDPAILAQLRGATPQQPSTGNAPMQGQQQVTDPAILAQLQASANSGPMASAAPASNVAAPPTGLVPGSKAYAQWAIQEAKAGHPLPQVTKALPAVQGTMANMTGPLDQINAGYTAAVNAMPFGNKALDSLEAVKAGIYGAPQSQIAAEDATRANQNPVATGVGTVAGAVLPFAVGGEIPMVAKAFGMDSSVPLLGRMAAGAISNGALSAGDAASRGQDPLIGGVTGAVLGGAAPAVGRMLTGAGAKAADAATTRAQATATDTAIKAAGGPQSVADVKAAAQGAFQSAYGPNQPLMAVTPQAYQGFLQNIENALVKIRPNAANDPQAVGLLSHLQALGKLAATPGTVVDLQDLHLVRQLAGKVAQSSSGRDSAVGSIVTSQLDNFVKGLKPADVLGGGDPSKAANSLFQGISDWSRMNRMQIVQDAIDKAQGYPSGMENGLRLTFNGLIRDTKQFAQFTPAEQQAIQQVAKGTTTQNLANLVGKMGLTLNKSGGASHNILGAGIGITGTSAALTPFLGPLALPAALGATTLAGTVGRNVAEKIANRSAARALQTFAVPNIPIAPPSPNLAGIPANIAAMLTRTAPYLTLNGGQPPALPAGVPGR